MRRTTGALLLLLLWTCSKDGSGPSNEPALITRKSGNAQSGPVAQVLPLPLVVRVTAPSGPAAGVHVLYAVKAGGGQVSATDVVTDAQGEAQVTWVLGTAAGIDQDTVTATVAGLSGSPITFTASAFAGPIADITVVGGGYQMGAVSLKLPDSVVALVTDGWGNPIVGTRVVYTITTSTYSSYFQPDTATTDATGRARSAWRLADYPGTYVAQVKPSLAALPTAPATAIAIQVTALASGENHSCALIDDGGNHVQGMPYCWGANEHFQLGDNRTANSNVPHQVIYGLVFMSLALGNDYSCGLAHDNSAWCWGGNANGQLGDGSTQDRVDPTRVQGGLTFQKLVAGSHTCGLTADGDLYCWGTNGRGQLGDGTTTDRATPTLVTGAHKFLYVAVSRGPVTDGDGHTCALTDGNLAMCWGANSDGQLGDGTNDDSPVPVAVNVATQFNQISAGTNHTCALAWSDIYCWGSNSNGQFGDGSVTGNPLAPVYGGGTNMIYNAVSAGPFFTCGEGSGGLCWGDNASGQLGDSSTTERHLPVQVKGGHGFSPLAPGRNHTCGLEWPGVVYCWGANDKGQIGDGSSVSHLTPSPINWRLPPPQ